MKVRNKKLKGGPNPTLICPCGKQIDPQSKGLHPVAGFGPNRMLYHATDCGIYSSVARVSAAK